MQQKVIDYLLIAPDSQLDAAMKPFISKWQNPPKAIEILEVLDYCIHDALASGIVVIVLQTMYNAAIKIENTTHEEVIKYATWRKE